jgi:hypothetical protein
VRLARTLRSWVFSSLSRIMCWIFCFWLV